MHKLIFIFVILLAGAKTMYAQKASIGASLKLLLHQHDLKSPFITIKENQPYVSLLIETYEPILETDFTKTGVQIRSDFGTIATLELPVENINRLANHPGVKRIELPLLLEKQDTTMKRMTRVDKIHSGLPPLNQSYSGSNVLIGIIDDGIDIGHPDFLDSAGNSRVVSLWNMDRKGLPPTGFFYGAELKHDSIEYFRKNLNLRPMPPDRYHIESILGYSFHGTPVAGLAAGKNGVAPKSAISVVALTAFQDTLLRSDRVLDGINYLYQKALSIEKKCIVNISLGTMWGGPHDGKTLVEKAIDQFVSGKPDLLVVTSAGNNGNTFKHWGGFPLHKDSSFNFFYCAYQGQIYVSIPKGHAKDLWVSLTDTKIGNINNKAIAKDSIIGQTPFINIGNLLDSNRVMEEKLYSKNGLLSSTLSFAASSYNNDYDELIIQIKEHTSANSQFDWHLYRLIFKGEGKMVHVYYPFFNLHPVFIFDNNPLPNDGTFRMSDNHFTTVMPTHAFSVLSVGAYNLRQCYLNLQKNVVNQYNPCQLTYFTSRGPTFDGRIKPDLLAPGENVIAPSKRFEDFFGHEFFLDSTKIMFGGTSASSPIVAGMAALLWEQFPNERGVQIKQRLINNTYADGFTTVDGTLPNTRAGFGKADAFKAATGINTNSDSLCLPISCNLVIVPTPIDPPPTPVQNAITIIENPIRNTLRIWYQTRQVESYAIYDILGRKLLAGKLAAAPFGVQTQLQIPGLTKGCYFLTFANLRAKKFLKE